MMVSSQKAEPVSRCLPVGEKPFLCEAQGCGRSFAEYSSLRKHLVVHSGSRACSVHRLRTVRDEGGKAVRSVLR